MLKKFPSILNSLEHSSLTHREARDTGLKAVAYFRDWLFVKRNKKANHEMFILEYTLKFLNSNYLNTNCLCLPGKKKTILVFLSKINSFFLNLKKTIYWYPFSKRHKRIQWENNQKTSAE